MRIWEQSDGCNDITVRKNIKFWRSVTGIYVKGISERSMRWWEFSFLIKFIFVSYFLIYDNFSTETLSILPSIAVDSLSSLKKLIGSWDFNLANWHRCFKCCELLYSFKAENYIYPSKLCFRESKIRQFKREADVRSSQIPVTSRIGAICLFRSVSVWLSLAYFLNFILGSCNC